MKAMQVIKPTMTSLGHNMNVTRALHRAHGLTMRTGGAPADYLGHTSSPRNDALRAQIREKSCSAALLDPADLALYQAQQCCSSAQTRRDSQAHRALRASPRAAASATHSLDPAGNAPFSHSSDLHMAAGIRQVSILPLIFRAQRTSGRLACLVSLVRWRCLCSANAFKIGASQPLDLVPGALHCFNHQQIIWHACIP